MISVCMAVHNGERYLREQVHSVVGQLAPEDELVVVDDQSSDGSLEVIRAFNDARIRILQNPARLGVLRTFERAIGAARGEFIFLCDQDDLWLPHKVTKFLAAFAEDADTLLVISDAIVIDGEGRRLADSFFALRGGFVAAWFASVVKNRYLGCALAFRASLRQSVLPFPDTIPMHDMWIGALADIQGRVEYLAEPLIAYRRHQANLSPNRHVGLAQMLIWRWRLCRNLLRRCWRRRV